MLEGHESFKILLLGNMLVGKTCVFLQFAEKVYDNTQISTIGFDNRRKEFAIDENKKIYLTIWDTAGQEKFRSITKNYYKGANGIMIIYDVTDRQSFIEVEGWIKTINECVTTDIPIIIIGNKIDLDNKNITTEEGKEMANKYNCEFIETSAKTNTNIDEAFKVLSKKMIEIKSKNKEKEEQFRLDSLKKKKSCFCSRKQ